MTGCVLNVSPVFIFAIQLLLISADGGHICASGAALGRLPGTEARTLPEQKGSKNIQTPSPGLPFV